MKTINKLTPHLLLNLFEVSTNESKNFRYVKDIKTWAYYDGRVWILEDAYDNLGECLSNLAYEKELDKYCNVESIIKNTIINMQGLSRYRIKIDMFDKSKNLLNCINGVLKLDATNENMLQEHSKENYITKLADVIYDPEADCPNFKKSLSEMFSNYENADEIIEWLQKVLGLTLTGYNLEQAFYFFHGNGRNGKSTLVEAVKKVLGSYAISISKTFLAKQNARIDKYNYLALRGVRFVNVNEFESNDSFNENLLKQLTGGDSICFNINQKPLECTFQAKFFFITNNLPKCTNGGTSMERRMRILHFKKQFCNNQNLALPLLLQKEKSGILNWMIEGYKKIDKSKPIIMPKELKDVTQRLQIETIGKSGMVIEKFLIKDERHLMTPRQAVCLMRNAKAFGFMKSIKNEDYQPRFLAVALKKYASSIEEFSTKMQKFYVGVGISNDLYEYFTGGKLNMADAVSDLGIYNTTIEEQVRHHNCMVKYLTEKLEKNPSDKGIEKELNDYTKYLNFLLMYQNDLDDIDEVVLQNKSENENYSEQVILPNEELKEYLDDDGNVI